MTSKIDAATELLADVLQNPSFPDDEVQLIKDQYKTSIALMKKNPASVASMYINDTVFGDHPYGRPPLTESDIEGLTANDLQAAYSRMIGSSELTVFVVGGIGVEELKSVLNEHIGSWRRSPPVLEPINVSVDSVPEQTARVIIIDAPGAKQSNIVAARVIDPSYQGDYEAFDLANMIYGGTFTSRINANIREDKGWSYGVRSNAGQAIGPRTWRITAQVQTDKTAESIQELLKELNALDGALPFSAQELENVRNQRVRKLPTATASASDTLSHIVSNYVYGLADDQIEHRKAAIESITVDELANAFESRIDAENLTWFISGDLDVIEDKVRSLNLGPVEIWDVDGSKIR